jgi:hypothetical protein
METIPKTKEVKYGERTLNVFYFLDDTTFNKESGFLTLTVGSDSGEIERLRYKVGKDIIEDDERLKNEVDNLVIDYLDEMNEKQPPN